LLAWPRILATRPTRLTPQPPSSPPRPPSMTTRSRSRSAAEISFSSSVSIFGTAFSSIEAYAWRESATTRMRLETSAMDGWIASFTAMRVALGGAATRRRTLQPAPPQPTMATRARSSPTPSLHVSGTPAHRESPEIKDCHWRIDIYAAMGIEIAKESAIRPHSMRDTVPSSGVSRSTEAVVIGGGCMGTSIAWHLARRGMGVVVLERTHLAAGATGHSGALVRQHYEARIGIRLARESLGFFQRFEKETGYPCDFRTTGFLSGTRHRDLAAFEALLSLLRSEGVKAERLTSSEAKGVEPQLNVSDYASVVHDPEAGYADPIATAVGFARAAEARGAVVLEDRDVSSITTRSGSVVGVKIRGAGLLSSQRVILAAGNWTRDLARALRVPLPLRFVRGDIVILRRPVGFGSP